MAVTLNASSTAGFVTTADTSTILQLQTNGTAALTVDASQNTTIAGTLTTAGVTTFAAGTAALPAITTTGDTNTGIFFPAADTIAFAEGGVEAMRIDSAGNVGIGTASPTAKLHVYAAAGDINGQIETAGAGQASLNLYNSTRKFRLIADASANALVIYDQTASAERARIDSSGNATFGSASFGVFSVPYTYVNTTANAANVWVSSTGALQRSTSSLKYKTNVQDLTHGLADVLRLRAVTYQGKAEADSGITFGGLIAEEVHATGLTEFVQYAEDGSPDALAYGNMVALAFKAIQELKAIVDAQGAEIIALKGATA